MFCCLQVTGIGGNYNMFCCLQVTGIGGNYKMTCENVMTVLRDNKDSLMAVLEAFVYDPLLNWRLMDGRILAFEINV